MDNPTARVEQAAALPNLKISGFAGNRSAFATAALKTALMEPVTLILAGHINYGPLCLLLKLIKPQIKFGIFIYGCEVWDKVPSIKRRALRKADFIISISEYTKVRAVEANGLDAERISVLPNAIEWEANPSTSIADAYPPSRGLELLSVGRLDGSERQKGFDDVIRALPLIRSRVPSVRYKIVGTGTDLMRHKELAVSLGMSDRVEFLGELPTQSLHKCYEACDVFVMPSAQEGFGFVYLEAMQYRKPIVAARSGGAPEVVEDGVSGWLVEYGDTKQLAEIITELGCDPDMRFKMGRAGHQRLQEKFTFARFQESFREILSRRRPNGNMAPWLGTK
jgi:glycosyltransferase involved in cell wall biosynthesis